MLCILTEVLINEYRIVLCLAATTTRSSVIRERQNYEQNLLEVIKSRIAHGLGIEVNADGAVVRSNGTAVRRPPPVSPADVVNSTAPINVSIDAKIGQQQAGRSGTSILGGVPPNILLGGPIH